MAKDGEKSALAALAQVYHDRRGGALEGDRLRQEITQEAAVFVAENFTTPTREDLLLIQNAMLQGAILGMYLKAEAEAIDLDDV